MRTTLSLAAAFCVLLVALPVAQAQYQPYAGYATPTMYPSLPAAAVPAAGVPAYGPGYAYSTGLPPGTQFAYPGTVSAVPANQFSTSVMSADPGGNCVVDGCGGGCCGGGCGDEGCGSACGGDCGTCAPPWCHKNEFFGEFLWLRARDAEVVYAVPFNGPVTSPPAVPIQIGNLGMLDPDFEPTIRVGLTRAFDCCSSVRVSYSRLETDTRNEIYIEPPYVIRSMVSHPSARQASSDGLNANARLRIDFDRIDAEYRRVFKCGRLYAVNYVLGGSYASLEQRFRSQYAVNGSETVRTDIQFNGGGIRFGLEAERHACNSGLMFYAKTISSLVAGEFRGWYAQGQAYDASVVRTHWQAGRVVPIVDAELGIGWTSPKGMFRLTAGYVFSAWFNTVKTDEFIQAVQTNNFLNLGDTMTFDGLTAQALVRF